MGAVILWLLIAIGVFLLDVLSSSFFFVLFSIGAIIAAICAVIGLAFIVQIIIFAIVSIVSLIIGYPILKKKYKNLSKRTPLMEEEYIGKKMKAEEDIDYKAQIKVGGEYWTAINEDEIIHSGDEFIITGIDGIKLKIKKV